jgi:hypothetical protein
MLASALEVVQELDSILQQAPVQPVISAVVPVMAVATLTVLSVQQNTTPMLEPVLQVVPVVLLLLLHLQPVVAIASV